MTGASRTPNGQRRLTEPELAAFIRDLKRPGRARLRLEGIAMPNMLRSHRQHDPIARVDFVDCDLSKFHVDRRRFGDDVLIDDCTFEHVVWDTLIRRAKIRSTKFTSVTLQRAIAVSVIDDCTFEDCRLENFHFTDVRFRAVTMTGLTVFPRSFWKDCRFEDVRIAGKAKTLVFGGAVFDRVDLRDLRLSDSDLGDFKSIGWVRFPTSEESFVVPGAAIPTADAELADVLSPRGLVSYRDMAASLTGAFVVIDRSLFTVAPDLPRIDTTPADVDAIMDALRRRRVEEIPA